MKRVYDDLAEQYYEAMLRLQQYCEDNGINFRVVLLELIEQWMAGKEQHDQAGSSQRDPRGDRPASGQRP